MSADPTKSKNLAHARTLLAVAVEKVNRIADNHPQRRELARKLNASRDKLRAAERDHEFGR